MRIRQTISSDVLEGAIGQSLGDASPAGAEARRQHDGAHSFSALRIRRGVVANLCIGCRRPIQWHGRHTKVWSGDGLAEMRASSSGEWLLILSSKRTSIVGSRRPSWFANTWTPLRGTDIRSGL